jgi:hypothetical protein
LGQGQSRPSLAFCRGSTVSASQEDAVGFDFNQAFVAEPWVTSRGFKNLKAAMNFIT